eukprot:gb/GECH01010251.1/.p1 GENE.gb/GECH01010251.1/~~gb/GECH01010251.1/.p1  ORF type:complete len:158 (+),score=32.52 gb/GECH01010251.1/:1-474(+)
MKIGSKLHNYNFGGCVPTLQFKKFILMSEGNIKEAQQESSQYLKKHNIHGLFEHLIAKVAYVRPDDPVEFLVEEMKQLESNSGKNPLLNDKDISSMFSFIDNMNTGSIKKYQMIECLVNMGIDREVVESEIENYPSNINLTDFRELITKHICDSVFT